MSKDAINILLVGNNPADARLIKEALARAEASQFRLVWAKSLSAGLRRMKETPVEAVLLDLNLPESTGFDTFNELRTRAPHLPVILLSDVTDEEQASQALRYGAQDYLIKGEINARQLARSLRYAIERKKIEALLRENEQQYRTIFEGVEDAILLETPAGRILDVNQRACELFGYSREQFLTKTVLDLVPSKEHLVLFDLEGPAGPPAHPVETVNVRANGEQFPLELSLRAQKLNGQTVLFVVGRDITERKRAERALYLLSDVQRQLSHADNLEAVFQLVGGKIHELTGDGIVTIAMLDEASQEMRIAGIYGLGGLYESLRRKYKLDPAGFTYSLKDMTVDDLRLFRSSRLEKLEGGMHRLTLGKVPKQIASVVESQLGIRGSYTMGLVRYGRQYGGIVIQARQQDVTPYREVIETITNQAAIAIQRILSDGALRASEERYRSLFENTGMGVFESTVDGQVLQVNPAFARVFGYASPEAVRQGILDVAPAIYVHPENRAHFIQTALDHPGMTRFENEYKRLDGTTFTGALWLQALQTPGNQEPHLFGFVEDITERKRAEEARSEGEERFRHLYENATIGLYRTSPDGEILLANPSLVHMLGYESFEELSRRNLEEAGFEPEYSRRDFRQRIESRGEVIDLEAPWKRKDGTTIFVRESAKAIRDTDGKVLYYEGTVEDISERKRAEQALQRSEERFREIYENMSSGVFIYQPVGDGKDFRIVDLNRSGETIEKISKADAIGKTVSEFFPGVEKMGLLDVFQRVWQTGNPERQTASFYSDARMAGWRENYVTRLPSGEIVAMYDDVTERIVAGQRLAEQAEELRLRNEELARLYRASGSLISTGFIDLGSVSRAITGAVLNEFGQANCSVFIVQEHTNELKRIAAAGPYADRVSKTILTLDGPGLVPQAIRSGEKINTPDVRAIPHYVPAWEAARAEMTIPLKIGERVIGAIDVQSAEPAAFTSDDERLMSVFAERAALSLENARLFTQTEGRMQNLSALRTIDMAISSSLDIHVTLNILLDQIVKQLGIHAADILIFNSLSQTLQFSAGQGFRTPTLRPADLRLSDGYAGRAVRERQIVVVQDMLRITGELSRSVEFSREGFKTYIGVPLIAKGQVKGVLELFQREPLELDAERRDFIDMLGGQAAIAIDNAQLFESLQSSNAELALAYDETIEGWSHAMDLRDEETEDHSRRVTELTLRLANGLGIAVEDLIHIRRGALLHDIGKIGVPDDILRKPGPLSDAEWVKMRQHPRFAYEMLAPIAYLRKALDIPYCHHEKFDGSGYPRGLKGGEIPLSARIFAVVDVWDALISDRPYRKAWSKRKALDYIREQAGKHFDPMVVGLFIKVVPNVR